MTDNMSGQPKLDAIDLKILSELQANGRIQNNHLASRVGISPPPCLRRVRALLSNGFIKSIRAVLNEKLLGYDVASFILVQLDSQAQPTLNAFESVLSKSRNVQQCWLVSGETDYLIRCVAKDVSEMRALVLNFSKMPHVRNVKSLFVHREIKDGPLAVDA